MRRVTGLALAGLGAFLMVGAVLFRTYLGGQVVKFPVNEYVKTTLQGTGVSYFSPSTGQNVTGATMEVTDTVKGDGAAGTSSTAVWDEFTYLYDRTNHRVFEYSTRRAAFDRRTGQLVNCCGANLNGSTIRQTGLSGYVWPIGTHPTTYDVFDTTLKRPMPYRYAGTGNINGIPVYRFVEQVQPTQAGTQTLPGALVGASQKSVTLPEYYTAANTVWVDPRTGAVLSVNERQKLVLQDATGTQRLLLLDGDLVMTPASVRTAVSLDRTGRDELSLIEVTIPLVSGLIGAAVLVTGIVLARRRRGDQPEGAHGEVPEPALDPAL